MIYLLFEHFISVMNQNPPQPPTWDHILLPNASARQYRHILGQSSRRHILLVPKYLTMCKIRVCHFFMLEQQPLVLLMASKAILCLYYLSSLSSCTISSFCKQLAQLVRISRKSLPWAYSLIPRPSHVFQCYMRGTRLWAYTDIHPDSGLTKIVKRRDLLYTSPEPNYHPWAFFCDTMLKI